jgi:hypothetical protein
MPRDDHLILLTRLALWPLAALSAIFGPLLLLFPDATDVTWSWQIRPAMSAVVVGAGYLFGALAISTLLLRNQWHALNIALAGTWVFSVAMLLATLVHLDRFFVGTVRFYIWFLIYVGLPLALPLAWLLNRRTGAPRRPTDFVFALPVRLALFLAGLVFLLFGVFMFVLPAAAAVIWPWMLTPLMARVLGGWVMFIGAGALVAVVEPRYSAYRGLLPCVIVWDLALLAGSLLHLDDFDFSRLAPWVWFLALLALTVGNTAVFVVSELLLRRHHARLAANAPRA